jgi:hypothetical protein
MTRATFKPNQRKQPIPTFDISELSLPLDADRLLDQLGGADKVLPRVQRLG